MVQIDTVLIKVASRCNINCSYCYVYNMGDNSWEDMPNFISRETIADISRGLAKLKESQQTPFAIVLHGGEPLLIGARRLEHLLHEVRSVLPLSYSIGIQSNGMLISEKILDLCSRYQASISISLDGPQKINDANRIGHKGEGTFVQVMAGLQRLRIHPDTSFLFAGLLAVIDPYSDPQEIYSFFKSTGTKNVDFLYRDGNNDKLPYGKSSFTSIEYGKWLQRLVDIYLADKSPIKIRILDDYIRLILGGSGLKEGIGITDFGIVVVDTDGTITKNDTLKSNFNGADRFAQPLNVKTHQLVDVFKSDDFLASHALQRPSAEACQKCSELSVCGGGMPLHRWNSKDGYNNPSVYCHDQLHVIRHIKRKVSHAINESSAVTVS